MDRKKLKNILNDIKLPSGDDWTVEKYQKRLNWTASSLFHQTDKYNVEGLYKPISLVIDFAKLSKGNG